jgi:hypothetical protein
VKSRKLRKSVVTDQVEEKEIRREFLWANFLKCGHLENFRRQKNNIKVDIRGIRFEDERLTE